MSLEKKPHRQAHGGELRAAVFHYSSRRPRRRLVRPKPLKPNCHPDGAHFAMRDLTYVGRIDKLVKSKVSVGSMASSSAANLRSS